MVHSVFDGYYYADRPLLIKAKMKDDSSSIAGWKIDMIGRDTMSYLVKGDSLHFLLSDGNINELVKINPIIDFDVPEIAEMQVYNVDGGLIVVVQDETKDFSVYDLLGRVYLHRQLPANSMIFLQLPKGCYILHGGAERRKVIVDR